MGDVIFNTIWCVLTAATCLSPHGYAPYVMLAVNVGDVVATFWCGLGYGYLKEEGDFNPGRFLLSTLGFMMLGGFYLGGLSFAPGSDAYNNAVYVVFVVFLLTFIYRHTEYGLARLPKT